MKIIKIPKYKIKTLLDELKLFYSTFKGSLLKQKMYFDLSSLEWVTPLIILPISSYIFDTKSDYKLPKNNKVFRYLNIVCFPSGISSFLSLKKSKDYIPISRIENKSDPLNKGKFVMCLLNLIYKCTNSIEGTKNVLYYPISELVDNIFEHSKKDYGFVFGQIFKKKGYLELCILDTGRGLSKAYKEECNLDISDGESIKAAMSGNSTKDSKERGFGLRTSKKVVCEKLHGEFILLSGNSVLISKNNEEKIIKLPNFYWQGVVISYRIPFPKSKIDISDVLEGSIK
jgi:hypothetical protein